jgi:hypothetical protein
MSGIRPRTDASTDPSLPGRVLPQHVLGKWFVPPVETSPDEGAAKVSQKPEQVRTDRLGQ